MVSENKIYEFIISKIECYPGVRFGITDISFSNYSDKYKHALVIAVPHKKTLSLSNYSEEKFEEVIGSAREDTNIIISDLTKLFQKYNIEHFIPPMAQKDEESLMAPFSFKYAAVMAGIGWIGKNGVLTTNEFGPRVRLSCILINYDLPVGSPIIQSLCGDGCFICVDACPYKALKGIQWDINKMRRDLIDYQLCNIKRSRYLIKRGRKNACGLCMAACPLGIKHN